MSDIQPSNKYLYSKIMLPYSKLLIVLTKFNLNGLIF